MSDIEYLYHINRDLEMERNRALAERDQAISENRHLRAQLEAIWTVLKNDVSAKTQLISELRLAAEKMRK